MNRPGAHRMSLARSSARSSLRSRISSLKARKASLRQTAAMSLDLHGGSIASVALPTPPVLGTNATIAGRTFVTDEIRPACPMAS